MIKRIFMFLVACMFVSSLLSGCAGGLKSKTVIISDADESTEDSSMSNEDFEINKIYQLSNNRDSRRVILGWFDNKHVLRLLGGRETSLELVDYRNSSRQKLKHFKEYLGENTLSPDGLYMVSVYRADGKLQVTLFNLHNDDKTVIGDSARKQTVMSGFMWSNNSRYVSYVKREVRKQKTRIVVYDVKLHRLHTFDLTQRHKRNTFSYVKVSNNGKRALLVKQEADQSYVVYGKFEEDEFTNQYEFPISSAERVDYINEDRILFISQNGSLTIFDRRNASSTILLKHIGIFQLSRDRESIAYLQERDSIFAANLQGNRIMNKTLIYKGMYPFQMKWSPDGKKILIYGRERYSRETRISPSPVPGTDQGPFIIEFK